MPCSSHAIPRRCDGLRAAVAGDGQGAGADPAQTALAWVLRDARVTSAVIGASQPGQIRENVAALQNLSFDVHELAALM